MPCHDDVTTLAALPEGTTVVSAGAPCTDLSPMGHMAGITGAASGLVSHVFRLVEGCATVQAVVIENVRNLLLLHEGAGIAYVTSELERLGFEWAYRVLDSFAFGLPQTRRRVVLVATRAPAPPPRWLLVGELPPPALPALRGARADRAAFDQCGFAGFYISEGRNGSCFSVGASPTIKSNGNGLRLKCGGQPHCFVLRADVRADGVQVVHIPIEDAERAQGLPSGWTAEAGTITHRYARVGNAVPVPFMQFVSAGLAGLLPSAPLPRRRSARARAGRGGARRAGARGGGRGVPAVARARGPRGAASSPST